MDVVRSLLFFLLQGLARFYESVMQGILRHISFDIVKCVIIASPGFVKDQFMDYMVEQAIKSDNKLILDNKSKFMLVHASSGFKHSLKGTYVFSPNIYTNFFKNWLMIYLQTSECLSAEVIELCRFKSNALE